MSGVVTFNSLSIPSASAGFQIVATSVGLASATSNSIEVDGPTSISFVSIILTGAKSQSSSLSFNTAQTFTVAVQMKTLSGTSWTATDEYITLGFKKFNAPSGAKLSGTVRVLSSSGLATFSGVGLPIVGSSIHIY